MFTRSTFASDELNATEPLPSREKLEALANRERNFQLEFGQQVAETLAGGKGALPSSTMPWWSAFAFSSLGDWG
jgi:hypothetical protein